MPQRDEQMVGLFYGLATFIMWGLFPIYFKLIQEAGALEILAHRIIWSLVFTIILLRVRNQPIRFKHLPRKTIFTLFLCGFLIAGNWGLYIYAVTHNQILEASLGYFINPLMYLILGAFFLQEKLSFIGKVAVFLVICAIAIDIIALGKLPFISIALPTLFALYGLLKKKLAVASLDGLFIETSLLFFFALAYLFFLESKGENHFGWSWDGLLLMLSGLVTVLPLLTFNSAAIRLKLSTVGFLQYITPSMATLIAVFLYHEHLSIEKISSFALIWISLILVSFDTAKHRKKPVVIKN